MILGYDRKIWKEFKIKAPVRMTLGKNYAHLLLSGCSGSGKSYCALWYLWQLLYHHESNVYIADYKAGEEYSFLEGSPSYASGENAFQILEDFYQFFSEVRKNRIRLKQNYTLFVEEYFGILTYAETVSKKKKTEILTQISELLAVGRGLGIKIIICVQRADSNNFHAGARDNFQCVVNLGRCSSEAFRMLGFNHELENNPTADFQVGEGLVLMDGQGSVREIKVPFITNGEILCRQLRHALDNQPDLPSLLRAVAEGKNPEQ